MSSWAQKKGPLLWQGMSALGQRQTTEVCFTLPVKGPVQHTQSVLFRRRKMDGLDEAATCATPAPV